MSLLVPAAQGSSTISTISALLSLNYPEYEVILVSDGTVEEIAELKQTWSLEAREFFYRQSLATPAVTRIYRSTRDARLMVVELTSPCARAQLLNCGVNLARFRYVGAVEPGLVFDRDALLRAMSAPLRDPAGVVAATSHLETQAADEEAPSASGVYGALQRLASIRSFMSSRLVWRAFRMAFGAEDTVAVWRRDAIVQLGGFSTRSADPDLEMMVRLQTSTAAHITGRVVRSSEIFGRVSPRSVAAMVRMRARRQLATFQTLWTCRRLNDATFAYILCSELLTPLAQAWIVAATAASVIAGRLPWTVFATAVVLLSFGNAIISGVALLVRGAAPGAPDEPGSRRLLILAPLDFVLSGVLSAYARLVGCWAFLRTAVAPQTQP